MQRHRVISKNLILLNGFVIVRNQEQIADIDELLVAPGHFQQIVFRQLFFLFIGDDHRLTVTVRVTDYAVRNPAAVGNMA